MCTDRVAKLTEANSQLNELAAKAEAQLAVTQKTMADLEEKLAVCMEEKQGLQMKLTSASSSAHGELSELQQQVATLTAKLKKKQEVIITLQTEKEADYSMHEKALDKAKRDDASERERIKVGQTTAETLVTELQTKLSNIDAGTELCVAEAKIAEVEKTLSDAKDHHQTEYQKLLAEIETMAVSRAESNAVKEENTIELTDLKQEDAALRASLAEISKTAESRKDALNKLANEQQDLVATHKTAMDAAVGKITDEMTAAKDAAGKETGLLNQAIQQLETKLASSLSAEKDAADANVTVQRLQTTLKELEGKFETAQAELSSLAGVSKDEIDAERSRATEMQKECDDKATAFVADIEALQAKLSGVENELTDVVFAKELAEKKAALMIKDLKKQFKSDQKKLAMLEQGMVNTADLFSLPLK